MKLKGTIATDGTVAPNPDKEIENAVSELQDIQTRREVKEQALEDADRDQIDKIILSGDVQRGGKIRLERKGPLDQSFQYIVTMPAEEWKSFDTAMGYIKRLYGGGDYQARTFRANGQMYKPFSFSIDHRVKGQLDDQLVRNGNGKGDDNTIANKMLDMIRNQASASQPDGIRMADMIAMMDSGNKRSEQMMTMMMTMMMKSQETMTAVLSAAITSNASAKPAGLDPILVDLLKSKTERTPMSEVLESMAALKELMSDKREEKEDDPQDMMSKITKLLGNAGPVITAFTGRQMAPPQPGLQAQVDAPLPEQNKPVGVIDQLPMHVRMGFGQLVRAAERDADPALYCDLILDNLDEQQLPMLRGILTQPDWTAKLWGDESKVAHIKPWLDKLRLLLLEPDEPDSNPSIPAESPGAFPTDE